MMQHFRILCAVAFAGASLCAGHVHAQTYTFNDLGTLGGRISDAFAINSADLYLEDV